MNQRSLFVIGVVGAGLAFLGARAATAQPVDPQQQIPVEAPPASASTPAPATPQTIEIITNTQSTIDDVRIAAYNFRDENGPSCALQVFVKGDPAKDQKLRVHAGQTFGASNKSFEVVSVEAARVTIAVK